MFFELKTFLINNILKHTLKRKPFESIEGFSSANAAFV